LKADHDGVEIEDRLPIFSQDIKTDVAFKVNIRVVNLSFEGRIKLMLMSAPFRRHIVYLGYALDLGWFVGVIGVDMERELELAALVHA
jgi:hypothetical protein